MPLVVYVQDRFDGEHGADHCRGGGNAAATLQEHEIIHGEPMGQVQLVGFHPIPGFLQAGALLPPQGGVIGQQRLTAGGSQGIYNVELSVRELGAQLLSRQEAVLIGTGEARGED